MNEAKGLFVSFEGIDGSGKSTQARLLADHLRASGREVVLTREPGGSPGAEEIRKLVLTGDPDRWSPMTEVLLFTAARRDHLTRLIQPALNSGAIVITDRFADSTRVYQGLGRESLRPVVDQLHDLAIHREPDLTFVIDMDPARALDRSLRRLAAPSEPATSSAVALQEVLEAMRSPAEESLDPDATTPPPGVAPEDRFETFGLAFQERVRQGFLDLAREHPSRITVIDGDRPEPEVAADVARVALARLDPA